MYLLIPGRHHVLTDFQFKYLYGLIHTGLQGLKDARGNALPSDSKIDAVIFAVTSANHSNTRRNPVPFYNRALAIQDFCRDLEVPCYVYGIDDVGKVEDFASYTIKRIEHESDGIFDLTPQNTLVICSTPVLNMYEKHGYQILAAELEEITSWKLRALQPWDLVVHIAKGNKDWRTDPFVLDKMHHASHAIWSRYRLGEKVQMLFNDKIVGEDGDITATRDYNSYVRQMDDIAEMKYNDTAHFIKPGRIGDIGCAVGSWIKLACQDERLRESDFYGIEVSRHLFDLCQQRRHNGEFVNPFVFFSQKNAVTGLVFEPKSMNTIFTSSLTHEIESYGSREDLLKFIQNRYDEMVPGGVWINRDVVGPENKEELVLMKLNKADGRNENFEEEFSDRDKLKEYLEGMSTWLRFKRFVKDFRKKEGYEWKYEEVKLEGIDYVNIRLQDATEFMTKKDYTDNWQSEMHERFCFWSFNDWRMEMEKVGFKINPQSEVFVNPWMVENRFKGKADLYRMVNGKPEVMEYPVTTMFLVGEK
jgi:hypothetical protein